MKYTVVKSSTVHSGSIARLGKLDRNVIYVNDAGDVHWVNVPEEDFTPEKLDEAVRAEEAKHNNIRGAQREI